MTRDLVNIRKFEESKPESVMRRRLGELDEVRNRTNDDVNLVNAGFAVAVTLVVSESQWSRILELTHEANDQTRKK